MDSSSVDEPIQLLVKSPAHWHIVLNRPEKYNAITKSMYERLIDILERAGKDPQVVLLSITGNGKFYSSGTDLADFAQMAVSEVSERREREKDAAVRYGTTRSIEVLSFVFVFRHPPAVI